MAGLAVLVCAVVGLGSGASAGGWAVTTLDETPVPVPGQPVDVGFTIRQHGITPIDLDEGVAIEVTAADGKTSLFPARLQGATGHYVASVVFPAAGTYDWAVHQGWFETQSLGTLTVSGPGSATSTSEARFPAALPYGLAVLAALFACAAAVDAVHTRRRRTALA